MPDHASTPSGQDGDHIAYSDEPLFGFERIRCSLVPDDGARRMPQNSPAGLRYSWLFKIGGDRCHNSEHVTYRCLKGSRGDEMGPTERRKEIIQRRSVG